MMKRARYALALIFLATPLGFAGCGDSDNKGGTGGTDGSYRDSGADAKLDVAPADAPAVDSAVQVDVTGALDTAAADVALPGDAPITIDGSAIDAVPVVDTGASIDAGTRMDTGTTVDSGAAAETLSPVDTGATPNGG